MGEEEDAWWSPLKSEDTSVQILRFLLPRDLQTCAHTCQLWRALVIEHSDLWQPSVSCLREYLHQRRQLYNLAQSRCKHSTINQCGQFHVFDQYLIKVVQRKLTRTGQQMPPTLEIYDLRMLYSVHTMVLMRTSQVVAMDWKGTCLVVALTECVVFYDTAGMPLAKPTLLGTDNRRGACCMQLIMSRDRYQDLRYPSQGLAGCDRQPLLVVVGYLMEVSCFNVYGVELWTKPVTEPPVTGVWGRLCPVPASAESLFPTSASRSASASPYSSPLATPPPLATGASRCTTSSSLLGSIRFSTGSSSTLLGGYDRHDSWPTEVTSKPDDPLLLTVVVACADGLYVFHWPVSKRTRRDDHEPVGWDVLLRTDGKVEYPALLWRYETESSEESDQRGITARLEAEFDQPLGHLYGALFVCVKESNEVKVAHLTASYRQGTQVAVWTYPCLNTADVVCFVRLTSIAGEPTVLVGCLDGTLYVVELSSSARVPTRAALRPPLPRTPTSLRFAASLSSSSIGSAATPPAQSGLPNNASAASLLPFHRPWRSAYVLCRATRGFPVTELSAPRPYVRVTTLSYHTHPVMDVCVDPLKVISVDAWSCVCAWNRHAEVPTRVFNPPAAATGYRMGIGSGVSRASVTTTPNAMLFGPTILTRQLHVVQFEGTGLPGCSASLPRHPVFLMRQRLLWLTAVLSLVPFTFLLLCLFLDGVGWAWPAFLALLCVVYVVVVVLVGVATYSPLVALRSGTSFRSGCVMALSLIPMVVLGLRQQWEWALATVAVFWVATVTWRLNYIWAVMFRAFGGRDGTAGRDLHDLCDRDSTDASDPRGEGDPIDPVVTETERRKNLRNVARGEARHGAQRLRIPMLGRTLKLFFGEIFVAILVIEVVVMHLLTSSSHPAPAGGDATVTITQGPNGTAAPWTSPCSVGDTVEGFNHTCSPTPPPLAPPPIAPVIRAEGPPSAAAPPPGKVGVSVVFLTVVVALGCYCPVCCLCVCTARHLFTNAREEDHGYSDNSFLYGSIAIQLLMMLPSLCYGYMYPISYAVVGFLPLAVVNAVLISDTVIYHHLVRRGWV